MAKLILTKDGVIEREYPLDKESISIGRRHTNDIQLNDLTVSGRHALVTQLGENVFVDDLGSTNGTLLNGSRVTKSMIKHGDIIQVGNFQFSYYADDVEEYEPTMFIKAEIEDTQMIDTRGGDEKLPKGSRLAAVRVLNGPLAKKVLELRKPFNTLGFNGVKMAVIARENDGYSISGLQSNKLRRASDAPMVNGTVLGAGRTALSDHDLIELAGTQMEFFFLS
ncbi:MAG TPA: FHA domain-containing protein [Gammaproteobacteria bacterium]|nr:FHA domain-containing protein [Gammaproteobacteria bacterium]